MDKILEVTPYPVAAEGKTQDGFYSRVFLAPAPDEEARSLRGNLFLTATFYSFDQKQDLLGLADQLVAGLVKDYFEKTVGAINEVLEEIVASFLLKAQKAGFQASLAIVSVWGEVLIAKSLAGAKVFLQEKDEILEFGEGVHQEAVGREGRLVLISGPQGEEIKKEELKIFFEPSSLLENAAKFKEALWQSSNPCRLALLALAFKENEVPGEEEKIEIVDSSFELKPKIWEKVWPFLKGLFLKLQDTIKAFWLKKKAPEQPEIYLKDQQSFGRRGKVFLALGLAGFLLLSILVSSKINENSQKNRLARSILQTISQNIAEGKSLASLNSEKAGELLGQARLDLGKVKGASYTKEVQALQGNLDKAYQDLYKTVTLNPLVSQKAYPQSPLSFDTRNGVVKETTDGNVVLIKPDTNWQKIIDVKEYLGNIYLLDLGASKIWKYLGLGSGFSNALSYFKDPQDLSNVQDWAIDGSVYLLRSGGKVEQYLAGKPESFALNGFYPSLEKAHLIYTSAEADNLYLVFDNSILVFGKDGGYKKQLVLQGLQKIDALQIDEKKNEILLKAGNKIYQAVLP